MLEWKKRPSISHAVSLRVPAEQWRCVEALAGILAADPHLSAVHWTKTRVLVWLVWRGLASLTPADIRRGAWDAQAPQAMQNWLALATEGAEP